MKVQHQGLPHTRIALRLVLLLAFIALLATAPMARAPNAYAVEIYEVTSNGDDSDNNIGDGHCCVGDTLTYPCTADHATNMCTLRAAIEEANSTSELDEIDFDIPSDSPHTTCIYDTTVVPPAPTTPPVTAICPPHPLPSISAPIIIDGKTQPGYTTGTPIIELDGHNGNDVGVGAGVDGLIITAGGSTVKGLWIHGFGRYGIDLRTIGGNHIEANWIGDIEDANDDVTDPWWPNMNDGIFVYNIPGNFIGGTTSDKRNVISGNGGIGTSPGYGVTISGGSASGNLVQGNYIGTDPSGTLDRGNTKAGVYINGAPNNNNTTVGGTTGTTPGGPCSGACNLISGNTGGGVEIAGATATGNVVEGNFIGTTADGLAARGNSGSGVYVNGAPSNTIGGTSTAARNVISKNGDGVKISGSASTGNVIEGNHIGTNAPGAVALGNSSQGVYISSAPGNTIGGTAAGARNVISGNTGRGITISGSAATDNYVQGNYIGTDATGIANVRNSSDGIYISSANNTIGGTTEAARNIIAFNGRNSSGECVVTTYSGVYINSSTAQSNVVEGNSIGVTVSGGYAGNCVDGVRINGAQKNTIGGTESGAGNVISGNLSFGEPGVGVDIIGVNGKENVVRGNTIWGNVDGVFINGAPTNTIGGTAAGEGNLISGNGRGVTIYLPAATGNLVQGNFIGTDITGAITDPDGMPNSGDELGNIGDGVFISRAPGNTIGGTAAGARNVISGNGAVGVEIYETEARGNYVVGNYIGTNLAGTAALGNAADGVFINNAPSNVIGGTTTSARNVISANYNGINISGYDAANSVIQGNRIGTNAAGTGGLGNTFDGVRVGAFSSSTSVGGTLAGAGNTIAFNGGNGVLVDRSTGNGILGNSIFSNTGSPPLSYGLGIDLVTATEGSGPNPNDDDDVDTGGNNYQNFPELTSATSGSSSTNIQGTFNSTPSTSNYRIEFFANPTCDPSGYGEGKTYVGFTTVSTNASGDASVNVVLPVAIADGWFITATATDPANNTSEFSQCRRVTGPPTPTPTPTATPTVTRTPTPTATHTATPRATATPCPGGICPPPSGDVNYSGTVTMVDAMLIAQYVAGLIGPGDLDLAQADVNCSGNVGMVDAMLIAQYVAGLIPEFTCS